MISFSLTTCAQRPVSMMPRLERLLRAHVCGGVEGSALVPAIAWTAFTVASFDPSEGADVWGPADLEVLRLVQVRGAGPAVFLLPGVQWTGSAAIRRAGPASCRASGVARQTSLDVRVFSLKKS